MATEKEKHSNEADKAREKEERTKKMFEKVNVARETASKHLKQFREIKGLNQEDFAECVSVSTSTLAGSENDNRGMTIDTALRIALAYGISLDWLFGLRDTKASDIMSDIILSLDRVFKIQQKKSIEKHDDGDNYHYEETAVYVDEKFHNYIQDIQDIDCLKSSSSEVVTDEAFYLMRKGIQEKHRDFLVYLFEDMDLSIKEENDIKIGTFEILKFL